jgi:hypothetical protein
MSTQPPSREELARITNFDDLVEAPLARQEQGTLLPPLDEAGRVPPKRSTTDPLESNFGNVDVVEGLGKSGVKPWVLAFAWIFLAGPVVLFWIVYGVSLIEKLSGDNLASSEIAGELALFLGWTVFAAFLPYILLRRK